LNRKLRGAVRKDVLRSNWDELLFVSRFIGSLAEHLAGATGQGGATSRMDSRPYGDSNGGANIYDQFFRRPMVVMSNRASRSAQIGIAARDMIGHSGRK
jgi:hypothetical protein